MFKPTIEPTAKLIIYLMPILLVFAAYFALWPVPIEAVRWNAPPAPAASGPYAPNQRLAAVRKIDLGGETGPEHVAIGPDGRLYTGVASGRILRMAPDGSAREAFADTGGRPLGLAFDRGGRLLVADAFKGLLSIDAGGKTTVLVPAGPGTALSFPNALAIAASGKIYLTDSSLRFTPARWGTTQEAALLDVLEQSASGRVLEVDPDTGRVRVVASGFSLANGIALSHDERSLLVAESGRYRVWRIDIGADRLDIRAMPPGARILLDNLPGFPDNLTRGAAGRIWLGLAGPRNDLDAMAAHPGMRELALRMPRRMWPAPKAVGHVIAFTEDGAVVDDLQDAGGASPSTTGVSESACCYYVHNVDGGYLGWLPKPDGARR